MSVIHSQIGVFSFVIASAALLFLPQTPQLAGAQNSSKSGAAVAPDTITGKVEFSGSKPVIRPIRMDANAACKKIHPDGVPSQEVILNPDNTLRNVLVYVKSGVYGKQFPSSTEVVRVDQKGCMFSPHIVTLMVNQKLEVANSDPTNHNVHVMPDTNPEWNISQPPSAPPKVTQFSKPEVGVVVMCNIHPWMRLYVHVMANPYYAITGAGGTYTLKGLPPGAYTIEAWHEKYGSQEKKVKVGTRSDFTFTE
jgi:plastocyanin